MSQLGEGWAVDGVDLPEAFVFPVTKLGIAQDVRGGGPFVGDSHTRVDCHVNIEVGSRRLEILSALSPLTGAELDVAWEFEQQFPLALWLYRSPPCGIAPWATRHPRGRRYMTQTVRHRRQRLASPALSATRRLTAFGGSQGLSSNFTKTVRRIFSRGISPAYSRTMTSDCSS